MFHSIVLKITRTLQQIYVITITHLYMIHCCPSSIFGIGVIQDQARGVKLVRIRKDCNHSKHGASSSASSFFSVSPPCITMSHLHTFSYLYRCHDGYFLYSYFANLVWNLIFHAFGITGHGMPLGVMFSHDSLPVLTLTFSTH